MKATNSMKDALIESAKAEYHARGMKDQRDKDQIEVKVTTKTP